VRKDPPVRIHQKLYFSEAHSKMFINLKSIAGHVSAGQKEPKLRQRAGDRRLRAKGPKKDSTLRELVSSAG